MTKKTGHKDELLSFIRLMWMGFSVYRKNFFGSFDKFRILSSSEDSGFVTAFRFVSHFCLACPEIKMVPPPVISQWQHVRSAARIGLNSLQPWFAVFMQT